MMESKSLDVCKKQNNIIFMCRYCKEQFYTWKERKEHESNCNIRPINIDITKSLELSN